MAISFDDQLLVIDEHIQRQRKWVQDNRNKYHSGFIAKKDVELEQWEAVRETVRKARQDQQMTGMSGKRIDS